jgi:hypothetical protein
MGIHIIASTKIFILISALVASFIANHQKLSLCTDGPYFSYRRQHALDKKGFIRGLPYTYAKSGKFISDQNRVCLFCLDTTRRRAAKLISQVAKNLNADERVKERV